MNFQKRYIGWLVLAVGLGAYIYIAGKTGSCSACALIVQSAGIVSGPQAEAPAYPDSPLKVGQSIPAGMLTTEEGARFDLAASVAEKPTVLVFYRGGWCPYCNRHLAALSDIVPDLQVAGFQILAISPDRPDILRAHKAMGEAPYRLLSDSSMEMSRKFGIAFTVEDSLVAKYKDSYGIDLEADSGYTHHMLPHPSVYIVDPSGKIRFTYVNEDYKVRLEPEKILAEVRKIQAQ